MKIFIMVDMEGISGVVDFNKQATPEGSDYQRAREYLMSDVNAAIEGAIEAGAKEIVVFDMHYYGLNILLDKINPQVKVVIGKPAKIYPLLKLDESCKGMMMIGYHAMAGTKGGLITHTYDFSMKNLYLNDILIGEIGMEAAIAGTYGVPLIMVSGDSKAMKEVKELPTDFEKAVVKYAINEHSALCLPLSVTRKIIKEKAKSAVKKIEEYKPYVVSSPYIIRVEFFETLGTEKAVKIHGIKRLGDKMVEFKGDDLPFLWENFISKYQGYAVEERG